MHHGKTEERTGCRSIATRHAAADINCGGAELKKELGRYNKHARQKGLELMCIKVISKHTNETNLICLSPETNEQEL